MKPLLILGIDPGTTTGYAAIDMQGSIIKFDSSKQFDLANLIKEITPLGFVIVTATDKKTVPGFVEKCNARLGARIIAPDKDMLVEEKREIIRSREVKTNDHERDALASALFAYKKLHALLDKIDKFIANTGKEDIRNPLTRMVILHEDIPIRVAADLLERPEKEETRLIRKIIQQKTFSKEYLALYEKLRSVQKEYSYVVDYNKSLKEELAKTNKDYKDMLGKIERKVSRIRNGEAGFSTSVIRKLEDDVQSMQQQNENLHKEIRELHQLIKKMDDKLIVKKVKNLGNAFFKENEILEIKERDVLWIEDASVHSKETLDFLKEKVGIVITAKPTKMLKEHFLVIEEDKLKLFHTKHFAAVAKHELEKQLDKTKLFQKIVEEYKNERN